MFVGSVEQTQQVIQPGCGGVTRRVCAGRQLGAIDGVVGHLAVSLSPFERAAQKCSALFILLRDIPARRIRPKALSSSATVIELARL